MNQFKIILSILCALLLVSSAHATQRNLTVTSTPAQVQKRVALVIGNAAYQGAPALRNPVNDAKAMSNALNGLGFEVIEVTDATEKEMLRAITAFGSKLNTETAALFFYAGHGMQVRGKNYIIPVDAQIETEAAVATEAVSIDAVLEQLNTSPVSIIILDACRNNPFERSFRKMGGGGLAQMDAPKGSFIAYATAPGKTASDGDGNNGLFTQELLKQIKESGLTLETVFKRVRSNVATKSGDAQMPWDSSSMTGEFFFKPGNGTQVTNLEPVSTQHSVHVNSKEEIEQETWNGARDSNNVDAVKEYLKQYKEGRFVGQAKVLLATLKNSDFKPAETNEPTPTPAGNDSEGALWEEVQKGNTDDDYNAYLAQYPKGKYVALAKSRIKKLQELKRIDQLSTTIKGNNSKLDSIKKETSTDPRKELANRGVLWDPEKFADAIDNNDIETVGLFLDGKMSILASGILEASISRMFIKGNFLSHKKTIEFMRSKGVDFILDFAQVPDVCNSFKCTSTPLRSATRSVSYDELDWLLKNNDHSTLKIYGDVLNALRDRYINILNPAHVSSCNAFDDEYKVAKLLIDAGIMMDKDHDLIYTVIYSFYKEGATGCDRHVELFKHSLTNERRETIEREVNASLMRQKNVKIDAEIARYNKVLSGGYRIPPGVEITRNGKSYLIQPDKVIPTDEAYIFEDSFHNLQGLWMKVSEIQKRINELQLEKIHQ